MSEVALYAAAAFCILSGLVRNVSELQCFFFKQGPRNARKVQPAGS